MRRFFADAGRAIAKELTNAADDDADNDADDHDDAAGFLR